MYEFELVQPTTVAAASAAIASSGGKALAGGQSLIGAMKLRLAQPGTLVDLSGIEELKRISQDASGVTIGAMVTHAQVGDSDVVKRALPALASLAGGIGDRQVRNMGTLGGAVAHNDPAACYPAAILALNATIRTNTRTIAGDAFFTGMYETALADGEIITSVTFPIPVKAGYVKFPNPASRFAMVGVFVAQLATGVTVAVTGAASCVYREKKLEDALSRSFTPEAAKAVTVGPDGLNGDLHASPAYRAHLIPVIAARAVAAAG
jgi:aerobic carbon-monoxide dehydrogenase medium subunit